MRTLRCNWQWLPQVWQDRLTCGLSLKVVHSCEDHGQMDHLANNIGIMWNVVWKPIHNHRMLLCTKRCHIFPIVATILCIFFVRLQVGMFAHSMHWTYTNVNLKILDHVWYRPEDDKLYISMEEILTCAMNLPHCLMQKCYDLSQLPSS